MYLPYFIVSGQAVESAGLVAEPSRPPDAGRDILGTIYRIKRGQSKKGATSAPRHARRSDGAAACPCLNQRNRPLDGLVYSHFARIEQVRIRGADQRCIGATGIARVARVNVGQDGRIIDLDPA